jgi:hypothetical protein
LTEVLVEVDGSLTPVEPIVEGNQQVGWRDAL